MTPLPALLDFGLIDVGRVIWGRALPTVAACQQRRLLQLRLQGLALVSALLMLGWIGVEAVALDGRTLALLVALRVAFAALALALALLATRLAPLAGLGLLVLLQAVTFAAMRQTLDADVPAWLQFGYGLFPYLLVGQLSILPIAALPLLLLAVPGFALAWLPTLLDGGPAPWHELWLLALILAMAMWAGAAQLTLLLNLLSARWDAAHDPMTGLANRRSLLARLGTELAGVRRRGSTLSVVMFDLDRFKCVNDRYGHACGDEVIRTAAAVLERELRANDVAGRLGGEEFVAVLPDTALDEARRVADRIRQATADASTDCAGLAIRVTVSAGVAEHSDVESIDSLLSRADAALYAAKAAGRDRVASAPPRLPAGSPAPG